MVKETIEKIACPRLNVPFGGYKSSTVSEVFIRFEEEGNGRIIPTGIMCNYYHDERCKKEPEITTGKNKPCIYKKWREL